MNIIPGDNLLALSQLKEQGAKFDLVELDGPYMAGLEDWDTLTERQYIDHYAERLTLVCDILQPWGVVFVFGYPEGCAEIKSWAHRTETLYLRRWLTWYKNQAEHQGRKVDAILFFTMSESAHAFFEFRGWIKSRREEMGLKIVDACRLTGINRHLAHKVGGYLWFETEKSKIPNLSQYATLKKFFTIPDRYDVIPYLTAFDGVTNLDYLTVPIETAAKLGNRLRSKPVQLYLDLFRPTIPPTDTRRALILYGGSGNAGIAAAALGYDVTICESSPERCQLISGRWEKEVRRWTERAAVRQDALPLVHASQGVLL